LGSEPWPRLLQNHLVEHLLLLVDSTVDAVHLVARHYVGGKLLLDLAEPPVIDVLEGLERFHEFVEGGRHRFRHCLDFRGRAAHACHLFRHIAFPLKVDLIIIFAARRIWRTSSVSRSRKNRAFLTSETLADGSIGKVTTEISQRSASRIRRTPVLASVRALTVLNPIDSPSRAPDFISQDLAGAGHAGRQHALDIKPARILADRLPGADRLVGVVLVEHPHAGRTAADERVQESAALDPVLAEIHFAENAGIAGKHPVAGITRKFEIGEFAPVGGRGWARPAVSVHQVFS
jgi:hypothetical protein